MIPMQPTNRPLTPQESRIALAAQIAREQGFLGLAYALVELVRISYFGGAVK